MSSSTESQMIGPCQVLIGTPTTAAGADMVNLGKANTVNFAPNMRRVATSGPALAGTPTIEGVHMAAPAPVVTCNLLDAKRDLLADFVGVDETTLDVPGPPAVTYTALGIGSAFARIAPADIPSLCLVPERQKADGVSAQDALWLPGVYMMIGEMPIGTEIGDGGVVANVYQVTFTALYRETDHGGTAIPADSRIAFFGHPAALGLGWSLPAL